MEGLLLLGLLILAATGGGKAPEKKKKKKKKRSSADEERAAAAAAVQAVERGKVYSQAQKDAAARILVLRKKANPNKKYREVRELQKAMGTPPWYDGSNRAGRWDDGMLGRRTLRWAREILA